MFESLVVCVRGGRRECVCVWGGVLKSVHVCEGVCMHAFHCGLEVELAVSGLLSKHLTGPM